MNRIGMPIKRISRCLILYFSIIFCLITAGCSSTDLMDKSITRSETDTFTNWKSFAEKDTIPNPDINRIINTINKLSLYNRSMGSQGERDAAKYLKRTLESYGYSPQLQVFPYDLQKEFPRDVRDIKDNAFWNIDVDEAAKDGESQNVIAIKQPGENASEKIIIISAHYDDNGSGTVIDNATGVAVLMEVAGLVAKTKLAAEIRFVLLGGEEVGLNGSRYYVSQLTVHEKEQIIANINLDYIGVKGYNELILATIDGSANEASALFKNNKLEIIKAPASDYISFARAGIPAISLGQLPMPWKIDSAYLSEEEWGKSARQFELSRLDKNRLKSATYMVLKAISYVESNNPGYTWML